MSNATQINSTGEYGSDIVTYSMETVVATTANKVIAIVQMVYGIPSFLLIIAFFFMLGLGKDYQNSFYRLVQLDLLTNMLCYFNNWLDLRLPKHPTGIAIQKSIESTIPGLLTWSACFANLFLHMQFLSSVSLNIHRITSVVFFHQYEKIWSRWYPLYWIVSIVYSFGLSWPNRNAIEIRIENGIFVNVWNWLYLGDLVFLNAVCSIVYFILILGIGLVTAFLVSRKVRSVNNDDRGLNKKLTKIALTYCVLYMGTLFFSVITAIETFFPFLPKVFMTYRTDILSFANDMVTLSLPFILLVYDANIRRQMMKIISRENGTGTSNVFVSSTTSNPR